MLSSKPDYRENEDFDELPSKDDDEDNNHTDSEADMDVDAAPQARQLSDDEDDNVVGENGDLDHILGPSSTGAEGGLDQRPRLNHRRLSKKRNAAPEGDDEEDEDLFATIPDAEPRNRSARSVLFDEE